MQDFAPENQKVPGATFNAGRAIPSRAHPNTALSRVRGLGPGALMELGPGPPEILG